MTINSRTATTGSVENPIASADLSRVTSLELKNENRGPPAKHSAIYIWQITVPPMFQQAKWQIPLKREPEQVRVRLPSQIRTEGLLKSLELSTRLTHLPQIDIPAIAATAVMMKLT